MQVRISELFRSSWKLETICHMHAWIAGFGNALVARWPP